MALVLREPPTNRLLRALPRSERGRISAASETVALVTGEVLYSPGEPLGDIYFPVSGFVSLVMPVDGASSLEVGVIGSEGMLGIPLVLGVDASPLYAVVQVAGTALRLDAARFRRELRGSRTLQRMIGRYVCVCLTQLAQKSACTRYHVVEARLARSLLVTQDRAQTASFHMTQEWLAFMLGVRRVGVTRAASALQRRSLIRYSRGNITILDRRGLEAASCGCYRDDRNAYDRLLG